MPAWQNNYQQICRDIQEIQLLQTTQSLLEWDQQTNLPRKGGTYRAKQVSFLAGEIHRRKSNPALLDRLRTLSADPGLSLGTTEQQATVRELLRTLEKSSRLPLRLVEELARACSLGQQVWVEARRQSQFSQFAPALEQIVRLKREQAAAYALSGSAYDALLDDYEPGACSTDIKVMFAALAAELVPLISQIKSAAIKPDISLLHRNYPRSAQEQIGRRAAEAIGFDFQRGRLDVTHHPFCTELGPDDCRILTRYDEHYFNQAFFGTLHEAGHGLYEQGLRSEYYGLPPGQYCSLGLHESQSRLWENLVGRSRGFWEYFWPQTVQLFPAALGSASLDQFWRAINFSEPSLIRVEADEATYNLHIALRFELESALVAGDLAVSELPGAWSDKYEQYLGIRPANDAEGALQDVHWSAGLFGYFPTYTLGTLYASQLFAAAENELGTLESRFATGDFLTLLQWLRQHVHHHGQTLKAAEIVTRASRQPPSQNALVAHLVGKFREVYRLGG